jgi:hypothetical protein
MRHLTGCAWQKLGIGTAACAGLIALAGCADFGFPTTAEAMCGAFTVGCHQECAVTAMPSRSTDPNALSYHIGPVSCPARYVDDARRTARQACRDRGLSLSPADALIARQPPAGMLPAALTATFRCQA